jgi:hypothetical protein
MPDPAAKKKETPSPQQAKGSIWSKLTEERGKDMKVRSVSNIGPGEYETREIGPSGVKVPMAAFKSESIRSFFDHIYFETNQEKLAKEREFNNYKSKKVGPGKYNLSDDRK